MGSGKNGTFDIHPDLNQWALLFTAEDTAYKGTKILLCILEIF